MNDFKSVRILNAYFNNPNEDRTMSWSSLKSKRESEDVNFAVVDHSWEEERLPTLHSGFSEPTTKDLNRSQLAIQIYFTNGTYRARVQDREDGLQAFVQGTNLESLLDVVEAALNSRTLDWSIMKGSNNNGRGL